MTTPAGRGAPAPRGLAVLRDPALNRGTGFTATEREQLGLRGLLPPHVLTQEEQVARVLDNLRALASPLDKFVALNALHDRNEALFFRLLSDHIDEMMPLVYTPTVGLACQRYGQIFQRPRGLFLSIDERGHVAELLANWPYAAAIIVVTDGERILGLGDLGANGMGIPVGKLSLYTACAGIDPQLALPVVLDVGTDNEQLLADPYYIGLRRRRARGDEYDAFVDEFINAAQERFPGVLVQFEDFANRNAFRLLERYRERICAFNDDIQGTAAVALAGIYSALRVTRGKLAEQKLLFFGAGEAAIGIANLFVAALVAEGTDDAAARGRCWLFDSQGLVTAGRGELGAHKRPYAHEYAGHAPQRDLAAAIRELKPSVLVGVAAVGGAFDEQVCRAMAGANERPIVFALSNPTAQAECTAEQAYRWTYGRALFACGSPFAPVEWAGRSFVPRQGNNSYIFPGVGLGAIACKAQHLSDEMFLAAARALAETVSDADLAQGSLYPALARIREVSARIASAVAATAFVQGLAGIAAPADLAAHVRAQMYDPRY